jgi:hypothetical protein
MQLVQSNNYDIFWDAHSVEEGGDLNLTTIHSQPSHEVVRKVALFLWVNMRYGLSTVPSRSNISFW